MTVGFEKAAIKVEKVEEFGQLQRAIEEAFSPQKVQRFMKGLQRTRVRIRDFDAVVVLHALEAATGSADLKARQVVRVANPFRSRPDARVLSVEARGR
jgi:hypothetical protein